jgi:glutamyl-tRNA reductase
MTLLAVGLSHRSAPVALLDRVALTSPALPPLLHDVSASTHVAETMVVATCNRVEVYADVSRFHGALADITDRLAKHTGVSREELTPHLYVHYDDRAVAHLFAVASGLDSMVVGEPQILGQVRAALRLGQDETTVGRSLNEVGQEALRVGKKVHSTTGIDRSGQSVVSVALAAAAPAVGGLEGASAAVVGAGSLSALAAATLRRAGVGDLVVLNRTLEHAERVAAEHGGRAATLDGLEAALLACDVVVSCTGASGLVLDLATVEQALAARGGRPLAVVDLALPHDSDPQIAVLPGVTRLDLAAVAAQPEAQASERDIELARTIVADEVAAFTAAVAAARVEPVVVSLRARADAVVDVELQRLRLRTPDLDPATFDEVAHSVRRAVKSLLHTPTVRMKEFASEPDGTRYAAALHALFDLDPEAVASLVAPLDSIDPLAPLPGAPSQQKENGS